MIGWHQLLQPIVGHDVGPVSPKAMCSAPHRGCIQKEWITKEGEKKGIRRSHVFIVEMSRLHVLQQVVERASLVFTLVPRQDPHQVEEGSEMVVSNSKAVASRAHRLAREANSNEVNLPMACGIIPQHCKTDVLNPIWQPSVESLNG